MIRVNNCLIISICSVFLLASSCQSEEKSNADDEEWTALFNGTDLSGWEIKIAGHEVGDNYKNTFVVEDSMIRINYDDYEQFDDKYGHMYYKDNLSHYRLKFDYRFIGDQIAGGASWNIRNSGVMLHSQSSASNELGQGFPVSIELQLLGGLGDGDRTTGNVCTPGTAVVMGDTVNYEHCINSNSQTYNGDQWVTAEAIVLGASDMYFVIEGDTVLSFQSPQIGGGFISEAMNGEDWTMFGVTEMADEWSSKKGTLLSDGYIALQAESHPIDFRNISLLNLCGCMDPTAKNYKSYYVMNDAKQCLY